MKLLREEVTSLLGKGAVVTVEPAASEEGFYSTLFLVPKTDGRMRPVINLKALNFWVHPQHFKMEGIHTLRDIIAQDEWLAKLDLKDAYFTVPIHRDHWKFLHFVVDQVHYQFTCLPFGLSCAPWVFTKVLKPVAALLRSVGLRLIVYIDDIYPNDRKNAGRSSESHERLNRSIRGSGFQSRHNYYLFLPNVKLCLESDFHNGVFSTRKNNCTSCCTFERNPVNCENLCVLFMVINMF